MKPGTWTDLSVEFSGYFRNSKDAFWNHCYSEEPVCFWSALFGWKTLALYFLCLQFLQQLLQRWLLKHCRKVTVFTTKSSSHSQLLFNSLLIHFNLRLPFDYKTLDLWLLCLELFWLLLLFLLCKVTPVTVIIQKYFYNLPSEN